VAENPAGQGSQTNGEQTNATPASGQPVTQKWMGQLPDELKGNETLSQYSSLGEAMKGLLDGRKPDTKADGKDQNPPIGAVTDYKFSKQIAKELDTDNAFTKSLTDTFKAENLTQKQADAIFGKIADERNGSIETLRKKGAEICEQELKQTWGDKFDSKLESMKRAYGQLVKENSDLDKGLKLTQAENNPFVVQLLAQIGENISEHTPHNKTAVGNPKGNGAFLVRENEAYPWIN
jgi:hypothetical protein